MTEKSELQRKKVLRLATEQGISFTEYKHRCDENTARNKGFRNKKEYDLAGKQAKVLHITKEQYCHSLDRDRNGFYILPEIKRGRPVEKF